MKHAMSCTVLAAMLVATVPALSQPAPPNRPEGRPERPGGDPGAGGPGMTRPSPVQPIPGRPQIQPPRPGPGGPQIQPPRPGPGNGGPQIQPPRPVRPEIQPPRPVRPQPPRPGNGHRPGPPNYRPGYWHGAHYSYPSGHRYQRYVVGVYLPQAFWGSRFWWVNDWQLWGLSAYHPGYRWVRVGPDALLVSTANGRIIAVRHNIFW